MTGIVFSEKFPGWNYGTRSIIHPAGFGAQRAREGTRANVASLVNAESPTIIFLTNCVVTEYNNHAQRGTAIRTRKDEQNVISGSIEQVSVLNPTKERQKNGYWYTIALFDTHGMVDPDKRLCQPGCSGKKLSIWLFTWYPGFPRTGTPLLVP